MHEKLPILLTICSYQGGGCNLLAYDYFKSACSIFMISFCRGECQNMRQEKGSKLGSIPPWIDHVVCALNCQATRTPLLHPPFCCILPEASSLASIRPLYTALLWALQFILHPSCVPPAGNSVSNVSQRNQINFSVKQDVSRSPWPPFVTFFVHTLTS